MKTHQPKRPPHVMSPDAVEHERQGMEWAVYLMSRPCRLHWSTRLVRSFGEQAWLTLSRQQNGARVSFADGFRRMCEIIALERHVRDDVN
ncbi:MAG: hypothetical protein IPO08_23825 [Xanthomonadales bacterium]|nr:hypothetical protein [Xanthomonadales bacterium]